MFCFSRKAAFAGKFHSVKHEAAYEVRKLLHGLALGRKGFVILQKFSHFMVEKKRRLKIVYFFLMKGRNWWGKSDPATVNYWHLTWRIEALQKFIPSNCPKPQTEGGPPQDLSDKWKREDLSWVLTKKFLARPEKYFPRTVQLNLACFHRNTTFWQKPDLSKNFHRTQVKTFPCFPEYGRIENNLIFSMAGGDASSGSEWMWLHTSTPYSWWVRSIHFILLSKINFPLKMLLFEIRKSPSPAWKRLWGSFAALAVVHGRWKELVYYCVCKQGFFV